MRFLKALALICGLVAPAAAGPYFNSPVTSTATGTAWQSLSGTFYIAASSASVPSTTANVPTASTWTITLNGASGAFSGIAPSGGDSVTVTPNPVGHGSNIYSTNHTGSAYSSLNFQASSFTFTNGSVKIGGPNPWFDITAPPFNAVANGSFGSGTDITPAITAAISAATHTAVGGGVVFIPAGSFWKGTSNIVVPSSVRIIAAGSQATVIYSSGTGYAFQLGNTANSLSYGTGISNLSLQLWDNRQSAIKLYGTESAVIEDVYVAVTNVTYPRSDVCVLIDGANTSSFQNRIDTLECINIPGIKCASSGSTQSTIQDIRNFIGSGNDDTTPGNGSIGIDFGHGLLGDCAQSTVKNSYMEEYSTGIYIGANAGPFDIDGVAFEMGVSNGESNVYLGAGAKPSYFHGLTGLNTGSGNVGFTDSGIATSAHTYVGNVTSSNVQQTLIQSPSINGGITLVTPATANTNYFIGVSTDNTGTGSVCFQNGSGSASRGSGWCTNANASSSAPGDLDLFLSNGAGGGNNSFHFQAYYGGPDRAKIDGSGNATFNGTVTGTVFYGAGTSLTGTAASLTAGNVTTNANLTGDVTSAGNATTAAATQANIKTLSGITTISNAYTATSSMTNTSAGGIKVTNNALLVGTKMIVNGSGTGIGTVSPDETLTVGGNIDFPAATSPLIYISTTNTGTGSISIQAGAGSASYGGSIVFYAGANASHPGDVAISQASGGGVFRVTAGGLDSGVTQFSVDHSGNAIVKGTVSMGWVQVTNSCGAGVTSCTATCSAGTQLTGGGCNGLVGLDQNYPSSATVWQCTSLTVTTLSAYAICARIIN